MFFRLTCALTGYLAYLTISKLEVTGPGPRWSIALFIQTTPSFLGRHWSCLFRFRHYRNRLLSRGR